MIVVWLGICFRYPAHHEAFKALGGALASLRGGRTCVRISNSLPACALCNRVDFGQKVQQSVWNPKSLEGAIASIRDGRTCVQISRQHVDTGASTCRHWDVNMWTLGRQNVDTGTSKCRHWDVRMWTLACDTCWPREAPGGPRKPWEAPGGPGRPR